MFKIIIIITVICDTCYSQLLTGKDTNQCLYRPTAGEFHEAYAYYNSLVFRQKNISLPSPNWNTQVLHYQCKKMTMTSVKAILDVITEKLCCKWSSGPSVLIDTNILLTIRHMTTFCSNNTGFHIIYNQNYHQLSLPQMTFAFNKWVLQYFKQVIVLLHFSTNVINVGKLLVYFRFDTLFSTCIVISTWF